MRPFLFERASDVSQASRIATATGRGQTDAPMQFLAGGTTLIDLMKLDGIVVLCRRCVLRLHFDRRAGKCLVGGALFGIRTLLWLMFRDLNAR